MVQVKVCPVSEHAQPVPDGVALKDAPVGRVPVMVTLVASDPPPAPTDRVETRLAVPPDPMVPPTVSVRPTVRRGAVPTKMVTVAGLDTAPPAPVAV